MSNLIVGQCKQCEVDVPAEAVRNVVATPNGRRFFFQCPACSFQDTVFWSKDKLAEFRQRVEQEKVAPEPAVDSQLVGNMVYGFKEDLDAFTVDEIIAMWEYDERYRWSSIPQETEERVWLR